MGRVQTSYLISANENDLFAYLVDLSSLPDQLAGKIDVRFSDTALRISPDAVIEFEMARYKFLEQFQFRVDQFEPSKRIVYRQTRGFFKRWIHTMILDHHADGQTRLTDIVDYQLSFGVIGAVIDDLFTSRDIEKILKARGERIQEYFKRHPRKGNAEDL